MLCAGIWGQVIMKWTVLIKTCKQVVIAWPEKIMKEKSSKLQATSLTACPRDDRIHLESRYNMETKQLKRIADAIEEILRLVREDMKEMKKAAK